MYGAFVDFYSPEPDPITYWVSHQSSSALKLLGITAYSKESIAGPFIEISNHRGIVLSVYEGCNGINVMIIFVGFLFSFGRLSSKLLWFIPLGLFIIHLANLTRVILLFFVSIHLPDFMYFAHKYLFTGVLYVIVFALWYIWVDKMYDGRVVRKKKENI